MIPGKIDPNLGMLVGASEERLQRFIDERRMDLRREDEDLVVGVSIRCKGALPEMPGVEVVSRRNEFVQARLHLSALDALSELDAVVRISALRSGGPRTHRTRAAIGVTVTDGKSIRNPQVRWDGTGVSLGVIDSGIDVYHPAFRQFPGGPTRIVHFWDRHVDAARLRPGDAGGPGGVGIVYTQAQIDAHLLGAATPAPVLHPESLDTAGHGSHVTGIAAGRAVAQPLPGGGTRTCEGMAPGASLIVVRQTFGDLDRLADLCDWIFTRAGGPCAVNISLGRFSGAHDGTSDVEVGLDDLLRDSSLATLAPRPGRFIAVAAGNERRREWHVHTRVLGINRPPTHLMWVTPPDNTLADEVELWCSGLDEVRVRLISPLDPVANPSARTHWVAPDPAGCIEQPHPQGFAPAAAGAALNKVFTFTGGTVATISQAVSTDNGDRQIVVRIEPPAAPPGSTISPGRWILELEGLNALPGGGRLDGYIRDDVAGPLPNTVAPPNTRFLAPRLTSQHLQVPAGGEASLNVFIPTGVLQAVSVELEYPQDLVLHARVRPPFFNGSPASRFVGPRPGAPPAAPTLEATVGPVTAPVMAGGVPVVNADGLRFDFGGDIVQVDNAPAGVHRRVHVLFVDPGPAAGVGPAAGLYQVTLRNPGTEPVPVDGRLLQDPVPGDLSIFFVDTNASQTLRVFPDTCIESQVVLSIGPGRVREDYVVVEVPAAAIGPGPRGIEVRVRVPPADGNRETGGWTTTPWIGAGGTETVVPGSLAASGGAGGLVHYALPTANIFVEYHAPPAGSPAEVVVQLAEVGPPDLPTGLYHIEIRGRGLDAPVDVPARLEHRLDFVGHDEFATALDPALFQVRHVLDAATERLSIPFQILRETNDETRVELVYGMRQDLRARVVLPDGSATPFVPAGPTAGHPMAGGVHVRIQHDPATVFPGHRRVLVTVSATAAAPASHLPTGIWLVEVEPVRLQPPAPLVARLVSTGHSAGFFIASPVREDTESGTLSVPGSGREIMSVGNGMLGMGTSTVAFAQSSVGPPRAASRTQVAANDRIWTSYPKPELLAPGTGIHAPLSSSTALWANTDVPRGWNVIVVPGHRVFGMRASWPLLEPGVRVHTQTIPRPGGPSFRERSWTFVIPQGAAAEARLEVRYDPAVPCQIRVEQPAGTAAPRRTHAVDGAGALVALGGGSLAAGTVAWPHPDGSGQVFTMGGGTRIIIRQLPGGRASVVVRPPAGATLPHGEWTLFVRHRAPAGPGVLVTVEAMPGLDPLGWPQLDPPPAPPADPPRNPMRFQFPLQGAPAGGSAISVIPLIVPPRMARDVTVRITYPPSPVGAAAYTVCALVARPGAFAGGLAGPFPPQSHTDLVGVGGAVVAPGNSPTTPAATQPANGRRFAFGAPVADNQASIVHTAGDIRITLSPGNAATERLGDGRWIILFVNTTAGAPAAPVPVQAALEGVPHDAPYFRSPGLHPTTFAVHDRLTTATVTDWTLRVPEGRRDPLGLEVVYDATDTVLVQVVAPGGIVTDAVERGNGIAAGHGATLHDTAAAPRPAPRVFSSGDNFQLRVDHGAHPTSPGRSRARIVLENRGREPLPAGDWLLRLTPDAIVSNGVAEAWLDDMLHGSYTGTSMATPHVAGTAALLLQQDHAQTHRDLKERLIHNVEPRALALGGALQNPGQWHPAAGWGWLRADRALLGHSGGPRHRRSAMPAAVGETTGCPVACQDNCLLQAERGAGGALDGLRRAPHAPHNLSPNRVGGDRLPPCGRLSGYLDHYHVEGYRGGEAARLETLPTCALDRPLKRAREARTGLDGFAAVSWDEAYRAIAERLVDEWDDGKEILLIEGRPDAGLVREALFNRFAHHLHRLLTATNKVKKCSFTTKSSVSQLSPRVPWGGPFSQAVYAAFTDVLTGGSEASHSRADLSLARNVVLWGANLAANAPGLLRAVSAARDARNGDLRVFAVDPAPTGLPDWVETLPIVPEGDRRVALALMLRIVGTVPSVPADAAHDIPPDPRFADTTRGMEPLLAAQSDNLADFIDHVRTEAAGFLHMDGSRAVIQRPLTELLLPGVDPAAATPAQTEQIAAFQRRLMALYEAYMDGPTATLLGGGPSRYVDGEEHVEYLVALVFLSGNLGMPGGGISFGEDRSRIFNDNAFGNVHDTLRPEDNRAEMGEPRSQQAINLASIGADAADNTGVALWLDLDPLTHLPDSEALETRLGATLLNVQIAPALDDSSRLADVILPMADTLRSYDLQLAKRSPWINLTQPLKPRDGDGPRPLARILHELFAAVRARLVEEYHSDLKPEIDEPAYRRGPLVLPASAMDSISEFMSGESRVPALLADRLPGTEAANVHAQLKNWYEDVHGGEPGTNSDTQIEANDWQKFFDRMQVDWIVEFLLATYPERDVPLLLYELLVSGTVLDPREFAGSRLGVYPDGATPRGLHVHSGIRHVDLKGRDGFTTENRGYRDAVDTVDASGQGRSRYPMRLIIAQHTAYASTHIPLDHQVAAGNPIAPLAWLNPDSPSVSALGLATGDDITLIGNLGFSTAEPYEAVIANARVQADDQMAHETVMLVPGWHGLNRGGQRLARAVHSEGGEIPAIYDNLVRAERPSVPPYNPMRGNSGRGPTAPKHDTGGSS